MRGSSLATRLFLSATAWVVVILLLTGIVLSSVFRSATERAFDRRLNLYLRTLIAEVATPDVPPDHQFQSLGEPLFELPLSGWYWQIARTDTDKSEVRRSRSLWDKNLPKLEEHGADLTAAGIRLGYVDGPEGQNLRMVERPVDLGADGKFLVSVAGDASEIFDETRSFDYYLGGTFAALSIVLVLTTIFQVRFGLAPLKRISESIADIRSGRAERLEGEFPVEIAPLARETNALIDANREIVERARMHVGNGIGDALQRRQPEADLKDRGQHQHDRQRRKRAAEIIVEGAGFLENLGCVAGHHHHELAVGAEIDRPLHHAQGLAFGSVDIADADAGRGQLIALLLELRQFLVPQRARGAYVGLVAVGAGDLPVPARQRQFEQRLADRLHLVLRRIVRGRDIGDQRAQIKIEPAVEGALGRRAIHRGQHHAGDQQDHHHPRGRRQEQPRGERARAASGKFSLALPRVHQHF